MSYDEVKRFLYFLCCRFQFPTNDRAFLPSVPDATTGSWVARHPHRPNQSIQRCSTEPSTSQISRPPLSSSVDLVARRTGESAQHRFTPRQMRLCPRTHAPSSTDLFRAGRTSFARPSANHFSRLRVQERGSTPCSATPHSTSARARTSYVHWSSEAQADRGGEGGCLAANDKNRAERESLPTFPKQAKWAHTAAESPRGWVKPTELPPAPQHKFSTICLKVSLLPAAPTTCEARRRW